MFTYRMMGAFMALAMISPTLSACAGSYAESAEIKAPPQPGMKMRCFTHFNPKGMPPARPNCWWYWPKTLAPK